MTVLLCERQALILGLVVTQQGPVAVGGKVENRLKLPKKAKLISTLGRMTCNTRMGRENATAGQAELRLRLSDDQRSQVPPSPFCNMHHPSSQIVQAVGICMSCASAAAWQVRADWCTVCAGGRGHFLHELPE